MSHVVLPLEMKRENLHLALSHAAENLLKHLVWSRDMSGYWSAGNLARVGARGIT
jgi:hypothetical protein